MAKKKPKTEEEYREAFKKFAEEHKRWKEENKKWMKEHGLKRGRYGRGIYDTKTKKWY